MCLYFGSTDHVDSPNGVFKLALLEEMEARKEMVNGYILTA